MKQNYSIRGGEKTIQSALNIQCTDMPRVNIDEYWS